MTTENLAAFTAEAVAEFDRRADAATSEDARTAWAEARAIVAVTGPVAAAESLEARAERSGSADRRTALLAAAVYLESRPGTAGAGLFLEEAGALEGVRRAMRARVEAEERLRSAGAAVYGGLALQVDDARRDLRKKVTAWLELRLQRERLNLARGE